MPVPSIQFRFNISGIIISQIHRSTASTSTSVIRVATSPIASHMTSININSSISSTYWVTIESTEASVRMRASSYSNDLNVITLSFASISVGYLVFTTNLLFFIIAVTILVTLSFFFYWGVVAGSITRIDISLSISSTYWEKYIFAITRVTYSFIGFFHISALSFTIIPVGSTVMSTDWFVVSMVAFTIGLFSTLKG